MAPWLRAALLSAMAVLAAPAPAADPAALSEYEVKAGFIYNFATLIEWPVPMLLGQAPVRFCILGEDPFGAAKAALAGRQVRGHAIEVYRVAAAAELKACWIVFVTATQTPALDEVTGSLKGLPVLTVADSPGYAARGVIINFYRDGESVRFEINVDAARRAGLNIGVRLLNLARVVHDGGAAQ